VPEISIKDQIRKLIELQKIDEEIYHLQKDTQEKPAQIEILKEQFESSKQVLNDLEEKVKGLELRRKEKELEMKGKEDAITKSNADLSQIKTNKEYTAKLKEIENIKADTSIIEEAILKSYDETDVIKIAMEKEKSAVAEQEKVYLQQKKQVEDEVQVMEDKIKVLQGQRQQITPDVDAAYLARYEKVLSHKEGIAIAPVLGGDSCGGCHMNVTPQMMNEIKMHATLVECPTCMRILYIEEDL